MTAVAGKPTRTSRKVSTLTATVTYGEDTHEFHFTLQGTKDVAMVDGDASGVIHHMPTVVLPAATEPEAAVTPRPPAAPRYAPDDSAAPPPSNLPSSPPCPPPRPPVAPTPPPNYSARMLGHIYAEELYAQVDRDGLKIGEEMTSIKRELASTYGFCSPESSLLMLYEADQFVRHGVLPPIGHPVRNDPRFTNQLAQFQFKQTQKKSNEDGIGEPKTSSQLQSVQTLAKKLSSYLTETYVPYSGNIDMCGEPGAERAERGAVYSRPLSGSAGGAERCFGSRPRVPAFHIQRR